MAFTGHINIVGFIFALFFLAVIVYMLFIKKYREPQTFEKDVNISKKVA